MEDIAYNLEYAAVQQDGRERGVIKVAANTCIGINSKANSSNCLCS